MSTLNLPAHLGIPDAEKEIINKNWDTYTGLSQMMGEKKLFQIPAPNYPIPDITQEALSKAGDHSFQLYEQLRTWARFLSGEIATTDSILLQIKNEKRTITASIRQKIKKNKTEKVSETDIEDIIWLDPRFNDLTLLEQQNIQYKKHIEALFEHCDGSLSALSRSVEFRKESSGYYSRQSEPRTYVPRQAQEPPQAPARGRVRGAPSSPWNNGKKAEE